MTNLERIKNVSSTIFIWVMIIGSLVFIVNWGFTDWEQVSEEFSDSTMKLLDSVHCEIDYKDFHYSGLCSDRDEIFNLMKELYQDNLLEINKTGVILNCSKERYFYCRNGALFQFTEDYPDKNVVEKDTWEAIEKYCNEMSLR